MSAIVCILIWITQSNRRRLHRLAIRYVLPENAIRRFIREHKHLQINRPLIDYSRCIGSGSWSTVYIGNFRLGYFLRQPSGTIGTRDIIDKLQDVEFQKIIS